MKICFSLLITGSLKREAYTVQPHNLLGDEQAQARRFFPVEAGAGCTSCFLLLFSDHTQLTIKYSTVSLNIISYPITPPFMDLEEAIRYEGESTNLDFKATIYKADKSEDLIKDIMAMANANSDQDRHIVVGVKHYPSNERYILGVEEFIDDATYHQLIHSNIEPEINFEYFAYTIDDKKVGVFRIFNCDNPPYMMKRDGAKLKRGDSFIRKGTSTMRLMRSDIDRMFAKKQSGYNFYDKIDAVLQSDGQPCTTLRPWPILTPPSQVAANEIRQVIADKERAILKRAEEARLLEERMKNLPENLRGIGALQQGLKLPDFAIGANMMFGHTTYEQRDIPTLQKNLSKVKETYAENDKHYLFEQKTHKLNILISNTGDRYLENCSVEITVKRTFNFIIPNRIYEKPQGGSWLMPSPPKPASYASLHYPTIKRNADSYIIIDNIGDIKHNRPKNALEVPFRLLLPTNAAGNTLELTLSIFGKNLPEPFVKTLKVAIESSN